MQASNPDKREPQGITLAHHTTCCLALLHYSAVYSVHCQCTVYTVHCKVYSLQCTLFPVNCSPPPLCQKQRGPGGILLYYSLQEFNEIPNFLHEEVEELQLEHNGSSTPAKYIPFRSRNYWHPKLFLKASLFRLSSRHHHKMPSADPEKIWWNASWGRAGRDALSPRIIVNVRQARPVWADRRLVKI